MRRGRYFEPGGDRRKKKDEVAPVWRGLGCIFMILIPILSILAANWLIPLNVTNGWVPIPAEFRAGLTLPGFATIPYFFAKLGLAIVIAFIFFSLYTVFYAFIWKMFGPSEYGPTDVPPVRSRRKPRKSR